MSTVDTAAYARASRAATEVAGGQHYPPGALYMVATPIGNLADITLRALHLLQVADTVACEDTRRTQALLRSYAIEKSAAQLLSVREHNEISAAQTVIERLRQGQRVAYASDAGTPAISDPGARLVAAVRLANFPVIPLPGASSVTTALSVAGMVGDGPQHRAFVFVGFLSAKAGERSTAIEQLRIEPRAVVMLEAPHRIEALALALTALGQRKLMVGRELTKQFEEVATLGAQDFATWLADDVNRLRGEFVLVLHPMQCSAPSEPDTRVLKLLLTELPLKTAVKLAAEITGQARNQLYELALGMKQG